MHNHVLKHRKYNVINIMLNPTGENPIWLPLHSEYHKQHHNVVQLVNWEKWVPMHWPKSIFPESLLSLPWTFH